MKNWPLGRQYYDGCPRTHPPPLWLPVRALLTQADQRKKSAPRIQPSYAFSLAEAPLYFLTGRPMAELHHRHLCSHQRGPMLFWRDLSTGKVTRSTVTHVSQHPSPLFSWLAHWAVSIFHKYKKHTATKFHRGRVTDTVLAATVSISSNQFLYNWDLKTLFSWNKLKINTAVRIQDKMFQLFPINEFRYFETIKQVTALGWWKFIHSIHFGKKLKQIVLHNKLVKIYWLHRYEYCFKGGVLHFRISDYLLSFWEGNEEKSSCLCIT